jgi:hypothetical protein
MQYPGRTNYKGLLAINEDKTVHHVKVGYRAVQHLTAVFDDSVRRVPDFQITINGGGEDSRYAVFGYRGNGAAPLITLWRSSHRPGEKPDMERIALSIRAERFESPVWVDLLSGRVCDVDDSLWSREGDTTTFRAVPVYDSVVLIADRAAIERVLERETSEQ